MAEPNEETKACPECRETVPATANLCRHCGYVFPVGKAAKSGPLGLTQELAERPAKTTAVSTWASLFWPLVAVVVVIVLAFALFRSNWRSPTWESAQGDLPRAKWYDSEYEAFVTAAYRQDGLAAEVRACDGICLINVAKEVPRGLLNKLGTKFGALAIACTYAAQRRGHGDTPVATVTIFTNGRRYASATCDGQKHPEFLR
jgi:hypothetical protein